jgi:hypothetical protein
MSMQGSEDARPLGARTQRFKIVDYHTVPWEDVPAGTPSPVMILVRDWFTEEVPPFSWHLAAEREGIPPHQIASSQDALERSILRDFAKYIADHPKGRWVHWGLCGIRYGLPNPAARRHNPDRPRL